MEKKIEKCKHEAIAKGKRENSYRCIDCGEKVKMKNQTPKQKIKAKTKKVKIKCQEE